MNYTVLACWLCVLAQGERGAREAEAAAQRGGGGGGSRSEAEAEAEAEAEGEERDLVSYARRR